nr:hypothetical protein [Planctomycetota bacterium]
GGLTVPGRAYEIARQGLALRLPEIDADAGALGLAAFGRYVSGCGGNESTRSQVAQLARMLPEVDAAGRVDPLGWFFATLAMREAGGAPWTAWSTALRERLLPVFVLSDGRAHVPAERVRFAASAGGDVFATSVAIIDLQAPYRYIPLAR